MRSFEYFYDFSCPFAYLASTQVAALAARTGTTAVYKPFLLGGVFRAIGAPDVPAASRAAERVRMDALDMQRWAEHWGVPLVMPPGHPNRTVLALRAVISSDDLPRASHRLFRAYWVEARDVSRPEVVASALEDAGFDGARLVAMAGEPAAKDDLRRRTDEAVARGVFGAPAFFVDDALYWGQDRIEMVERALTGRAPPEKKT